MNQSPDTSSPTPADATARLRPTRSLRPLTYSTLFGLLAATGLRISEARQLVLADVTTDGLVVRKTKFRKNRLVPLHQTTTAALARYLEQRHAVGGADDHVFLPTKGQALTYRMVNGTFHFLLRFVTLRSQPGPCAPGWPSVAPRRSPSSFSMPEARR